MYLCIVCIYIYTHKRSSIVRLSYLIQCGHDGQHRNRHHRLDSFHVRLFLCV